MFIGFFFFLSDFYFLPHVLLFPPLRRTAPTHKTQKTHLSAYFQLINKEAIMQTTQIYLTAQEVAQRLGVSRSGIYSLMNSSCFPRPVKFGRLSRWKVDDLNQWLKTRENPTNEAPH